MGSELTEDDERTLMIRLIKDNGEAFNTVVKGKQVTDISEAIEAGEGFKFYDYEPKNPGAYSVGPGEIVGMFIPEEQLERGYVCSQK